MEPPLLSYLLKLGYTSSHLRIKSSHCRNAVGLAIADVEDDVGTLFGRHEEKARVKKGKKS